MCATTQAEHLGLASQGRLAAGALADFVVLDRGLQVAQTWIGGRRVFEGD
jgi:N-acetylglucosamine-6-phosphate deacetylase